MKTAILSRAALSAALSTVNYVVEKKNTIPVLSNVRLVARDGLLLATGTDLDIETTVSLPYGAADDGFAVTVPAHKLADVLKRAPAGDDLAIDASAGVKPEDMAAGLDFGGLRVTMQGIAESEFPQMAMSGDVKEFDVTTADFRDALARVAFAISTDETRYYLNGIYMHAVPTGNSAKLRMVATDGHRMAHHDMDSADGSPVPDFGGVIVPVKTISHLMKVTGQKSAPDTMRVVVNHAKVRFIVGNVTVVSKLIEGTFPDYKRVIPSNDKVATFDRLALVEAIKAVGCISSERGRAVRMAFRGDGKAELVVNNPDLGTARFPLAYAGEFQPFEIGFNMAYATDILAALDGETVNARFTDASAPTIWHDGETFDRDAGTFYLLMPMRV
jgi:DNA polymerase III subunit beta